MASEGPISRGGDADDDHGDADDDHDTMMVLTMIVIGCWSIPGQWTGANLVTQSIQLH